MSKNYTHLTSEQRYQIEAYLKAGKSQKEIAELIGKSASTICRELKRYTPRGGFGYNLYRASNAVRRHYEVHRLKPKRVRFTAEMRKYCLIEMKKNRSSPVLLNVRGKAVFGDFVSHETIYRWIWRCKKGNKARDKPYKSIYLFLKHGKRRAKRGNRHDMRGNIPARVSIEQRPKIVASRKRIGDLEVDLMIGKKHQSALLVSLDRKTLKIKLLKLPGKNSNAVAKGLIKLYKKEKSWLKTITFDNDYAFNSHQRIAKTLGVSTYFTRPYTSQDKGSVENRIGLIRMFLPKKTDLNLISAARIKSIENKLNNRPVKKFNYKTPNQAFSREMNCT